MMKERRSAYHSGPDILTEHVSRAASSFPSFCTPFCMHLLRWDVDEWLYRRRLVVVKWIRILSSMIRLV